MIPPRCGYRPPGPVRPGHRTLAALLVLSRIQREQITELERQVAQIREAAITIGEALTRVTDLLDEHLADDSPPPRPRLRAVPPPG